jgi:hypothetical protein
MYEENIFATEPVTLILTCNNFNIKNIIAPLYFEINFSEYQIDCLTFF